MGYTTEFNGSFDFNIPVDENLKNYVNKFSRTRRMRRDPEKIKMYYPSWFEMCYNGELGIQGEYFVGGDETGLSEDKSVIDYNRPPDTQPGLWCDWEISDDGMHLEWSGMEKFYNYIEWLVYLIKNFFEPNGYVLNGAIDYQGEDYFDFGIIAIEDNNIISK